MSWDISFFSAKVPPPPVAEMPGGWRGESFGTPEEVRAAISNVLPDVNWSDPNWGMYDGGTFSYEFNLGQDSPCWGFMVHVRGEGDAALLLIELAEAGGWYMLDISSGEWVHHLDDPNAGWARFRRYRDEILSSRHNSE